MEEVKLESRLDLKSDFDIPTYEEWKEKVLSDLKGADFNKKLLTRTYESITLKPLYTGEDIKELSFIKNLPGYEKYSRGINTAGYLNDSWQIAQSIPYALASDYNAAVKSDLKRGLTAVILPLDKASLFQLDADYTEVGDVGNGGVSISAYRSFSRALDGIDLSTFPLYIEAGFSSLPITLLLEAVLTNWQINRSIIKGGITSDPIDFLLRFGNLPVSWKNVLDEIAATIEIAKDFDPSFKSIGVSTERLCNSGASAVQEISAALATAVLYLEELTDRNLEAEVIVPKFKFKFGVGPFYFMEIAKFRAFRMLWNFICKEYGAEGKAFLHAKTARVNQTKLDIYVNMLRTTTETFSAVVGGVDLLETNPFDELIGEPDEFGRRIARNTQIILKEESHLDKLIDPAGGSFYIESLTNELASKSWELFLEIQKKGGMLEAVRSGFIAEEVSETMKNRKEDLTKRKSVLVGVNMFANPKEKQPEKRKINYQDIYAKRAEYLRNFRSEKGKKKKSALLTELRNITDTEKLTANAIDAYLSGSTLGEVAAAIRTEAEKGFEIKPLKEERLAEEFEEIRFKAAEIARKRGRKPSVFLMNLGSLKDYKARADFSRGFFEVGGFDIIYPKGFESADKAVNDAIDSNADAVVICSTDEKYSESVGQIAPLFKSKCKTKLILAGYPKEKIYEYKNAGIDEFIHVRADALNINKNLIDSIEL